MKPLNVLIVDDEQDWLDGMCRLLERTSFNLNIVTCTNPHQVPSILASTEVDLVLLDLIMPGIRGTQILSEICALYPRIKTIMVTGIDDLETAIECMRLGAIDFLVKGSEPEVMFQRLKTLLGHIQLEISYQKLTARFLGRTQGNLSSRFEPVVSRDGVMLDVIGYLDSISEANIPILIQGEAGTGKSLLAQCVAQTAKTEVLSCMMLQDQFLAELCGRLKGYLGCEKSTRGALHRAEVVIIEDVDNLPLNSQQQLRDILKCRNFSPLGTQTSIPSNTRFIFTSSRPLKPLVQQGLFRTDLYYSLSLHQVNLPPLRDRLGDLDMLIPYFVHEAIGETCQVDIPHELYALLAGYDFPGNVDELRNLIFDAIDQGNSGQMTLLSIRRLVHRETGQPIKLVSHQVIFPDPLPTLSDVSEALIMEALSRNQGSQKLAAKALGISPAAMCRRVSKF